MKRRVLTLSALAVVLVLAMAASLLAGRVWLAPGQVLADLRTPGEQISELILIDLRLPRAILAVAIGATLGLAGAVLQGLLRNPLAEPGLMGVSSGASLGAVIAIYFGLSAAFPLAAPVLGMTGALAAGALTLVVGRGGGTLALILAGSAVSVLAGSGVALALNFAPNPYAVVEITAWLLGSLSDRSWSHVVLALPLMMVGGGFLLSTARALDALALGEIQAESLGVRLGRTRLIALIGVALAVGAATSVAGAIGFIGLVAPQLVRPLVGHQPSRTLVPSMLTGALLLLAADIATRILPVRSEVRLGVLTSLIGLPFFFWLVIRMKKVAP